MADSLVDLERFAKAAIGARNPIHFRRLRRKPARRHRLRVDFGATGFCFEVILFEVVAWQVQGQGVGGNGQLVPLPNFHWEAIDDAAASDVVIRSQALSVGPR